MEPSTTVLLTGARGFIGSAFRELHRVEAAQRSRLVSVDIEDADLRDASAVARLIAEVRPDRIVHLAGKLVKGESPDVLREQMEHTFRAGTVLLDAALAAGVRHLIIAGTVDEFGSRSGTLHPRDPREPVSYYGLCKSLLREYAALPARRGKLRVDWFRPFIVYGPGQTQGNMLLPTAFRAAKSGLPAQFSDGLQERDFIHVADIAAWLLAASSLDEGVSPGLYDHHLGSGQSIPVRTVLQAIADEFPGSQFEIGAIPRRPGEPATQVAAAYESPESSLQAWRPRFDMATGIADTARWWKSKDAL